MRTIQERVTSGDNAEALGLARKFVTELGCPARRENTQHRGHRAADQPAVNSMAALQFPCSCG